MKDTISVKTKTLECMTNWLEEVYQKEEFGADPDNLIIFINEKGESSLYWTGGTWRCIVVKRTKETFGKLGL